MKVWVCLFTCLVVRAVHLELVEDMTTESFLMCLRRFIARRGKPVEIISDNAATFLLAKRILNVVFTATGPNEEILSYCSQERIEWKTIVHLAPWMGGFYERMVGVVKSAMRKTISKQKLTYAQLETIICEVEAVVNSRPLVYVSDDLESNFILTPNHFLALNPSNGTPSTLAKLNVIDGEPKSTAKKLLQTWKKGINILTEYWKVWQSEYLLSLRERYQSQLKAARVQADQPPRVGEPVLIKDDIGRGSWRMGKILELPRSKDGKLRCAKILLPSKQTTFRPLNLLYPLETEERAPQTLLAGVSRNASS